MPNPKIDFSRNYKNSGASDLKFLREIMKCLIQT